MTIKSYKELHMWQKGIDVTTRIYVLTSSFPKNESYGITDQMRRAACSICANIAEGWTRGKRDSVMHYLDMANGSIAELETFLVISHKLNYLSTAQKTEIDNELLTIGKMINKMKAHLKTKPKNS